MQFLKILYEKPQQQKILDFLSGQFGSNAPQAEIDEIVDDSFLKIEWSFDKEADEVASALTDEFPTLVIESASTTGMEPFSRYFNGTQLW